MRDKTETDNIKKKFTLNIYILITADLLFALALLALFSLYFGIFIGSVFAVCGGVIVALLIRNGLLREFSGKEMIAAAVISTALSVTSVYFLEKIPDTFKEIRYNGSTYVSFLASWLIGFVLCAIFLRLTASFIIVFAEKKTKIKKELLCVIPVLFMYFIYVPLELQSANSGDYLCSRMDLLACGIVLLAVSVLLLAVVPAFLPEKELAVYNAIVCAVTVCSYMQFMFLNNTLGTLSGYSFKISDYIFQTIINSVIWLLIIVLFVWGCIKKENVKKYIVYVPVFIGLIQLVAVIFILTSDISHNSERKYKSYDYSQRYTVASEENLILFCMDGVDNNFVDEVINRGYDLSAFSDFTLYTNTCSVFDLTMWSMPQMITASGYENNNHYSEFFKRLKGDDYDIRFYNYEYDLNNYVPVNSYVDNYVDFDNSQLVVDYLSLGRDSAIMSSYLLSPYILKNFIDISEVEFYSQVGLEGIDFNYTNGLYNDEYYSMLDLSKGSQQKSFIYDHINGAHLPCDDYIEETAFCFDIASEYINQLKELGVYDESTIIFVADHGTHYDPTSGYHEGCTPMFMIKGKNEKHDEIVYSRAPVYHKDIVSTLLVNAGLYDENTDKDWFGPSIYDFADGDQRERIWYHRADDGLREYRFTGDRAELERVVDAGEYTIVNIE